VIGERDGAAPAHAAMFWNCPRCRLSIKQRRPWLPIEHCPRCLAHARIPVMMFSSTLPAGELYHNPIALHNGRTSSPSG
jgi:hypothetical protein